MINFVSQSEIIMEHQNHINNLNDLKNILSKNTRFLAFSGLSGIIAGILALIGEYIAHLYIVKNWPNIRYSNYLAWDHIINLGIIAAAVVVLSITIGYVLTMKNIKKAGGISNFKLVKNTLWNIAIPIVIGGLICLIALFNGDYMTIPAYMLIFYGLALFSGSKYSFDDLKFIGLAFVGLGLCAMIWPMYNAIAWGLGFGVGHIVYGLRIHLKQRKIAW